MRRSELVAAIVGFTILGVGIVLSVIAIAVVNRRSRGPQEVAVAPIAIPTPTTSSADGQSVLTLAPPPPEAAAPFQTTPLSQSSSSTSTALPTARPLADSEETFPDSNAPPPELPDNTKVELWVSFNSSSPGLGRLHGFATTWPGESNPIVVTAMTIFDSTNPNVRISADELASSLESIGIKQVATEATLATCKEMLSFRGRGSGERDVSNDLALFRVKRDDGLGTLPLAKELPKNGQRVWFLKLPSSSDPSGPELLPGMVRVAVETGIDYALDSGSFPFESAGSPVLNSQGEVVGLHISNWERPNGFTTGLANPSTAIRKHLQDTLGIGR